MLKRNEATNLKLITVKPKKELTKSKAGGRLKLMLKAFE